MTSKPLRLAILLLSVSLVLNFALGAFVFTSYVRDRVFDRITQLSDTEPSPALKAAFRQTLREDRRAILQSARQLRQAREHQHEVLTAPELDVSALDEAQAEVREAAAALMSVLQKALRQTAETLPENERQNIPKVGFGSLQTLLKEDTRPGG
ncbi:periplasmic heavy metal sensor [Roseibium sp. SCP14]|uniref:periplasmic heavy metal sensor n=1 Tax=Roseibium sp. SCP14 TaxID=3141375 RepID=UPI0033356335